jgi:hypothetical protein
MGQTVNLLSSTSVVRIHLLPLKNTISVVSHKTMMVYKCESSSVGRATAFQAVGRGFEPRLSLLIYYHAVVAQWQSTSLVRKRSRVQFPSTALTRICNVNLIIHIQKLKVQWLRKPFQGINPT